MARGKPHSDQTRAAVLAALLDGQSVSKVAESYSLSRATVVAWRDAAGLGSTHVEHQKKSEIGDLVADYLRASLATLAVQARFFGDEAWLRKQDAASLGTLHGIATDKAIRILAALESAEGAEPASGDAGEAADPAPAPGGHP